MTYSLRTLTHCAFVSLLLLSCGDDASIDGTDSQVGDASTDANAADARPDASNADSAVEVTLSEAERAAIKTQTEFELETMLTQIRGASAAAEVHTVVYRTTFAWGAQSMEELCVVNEQFPEGCRSGEKSLGGDFLFAAYEPDVTFDVTWNGKVGELAEDSTFVLSGVPTTWSDELPNAPNTESTFDISKHSQTVKVELVDAESEQHRWTRNAEKTFVENVGDVELMLAHEDTTVALATPIEVGFDVAEIDYQARYSALLSKDVLVDAVMDSEGVIGGSVTVDGQMWGVLSGSVAQDDASIAVAWADR